MQSDIAIRGAGFAVPDRVVPNRELEALLQTTDAWIREKIGIRERRYVVPGEGTSDLATRAAKEALAMAGLGPSDLEAIVVATATPDYDVPGVGVLVQDKLGAPPIPAYDVSNSSPGFLFAMEMAAALLLSGRYRRILVIGAEVHSTGLDFSPRGRLMSVIFGDGAGALVLERVEGDESEKTKSAAVETLLFSEGRHFDKLWCEAPSSRPEKRITPQMIAEGRVYPQMDGRFIFQEAVARMVAACEALLGRMGLKQSDIDWVVPHQANLRIIETLAARLSVPMACVVTTIERYGNLSSASIPVALAEAWRAGRLKRGDRVLCPSFGSGFSWGAMVLRL